MSPRHNRRDLKIHQVLLLKVFDKNWLSSFTMGKIYNFPQFLYYYGGI